MIPKLVTSSLPWQLLTLNHNNHSRSLLQNTTCLQIFNPRDYPSIGFGPEKLLYAKTQVFVLIRFENNCLTFTVFAKNGKALFQAQPGQQERNSVSKKKKTKNQNFLKKLQAYYVCQALNRGFTYIISFNPHNYSEVSIIIFILKMKLRGQRG